MTRENKLYWKFALKVVVASLVISVLLGTTWVTDQTVQVSLRLFKAEGVTDTGAAALLLGTNEGDYANIPSGAFELKANAAMTQDANAVVITFFGTNAANERFDWNLYGWRNTNGPAMLIADGYCLLGAQDVVLYPHDGSTGTANEDLWVDSIVVSNQYWLKTLSVSTVGGDSVAQLGLDTFGLEYIYLEITNINTAASGGAYISWF